MYNHTIHVLYNHDNTIDIYSFFFVLIMRDDSAVDGDYDDDVMLMVQK